MRDYLETVMSLSFFKIPSFNGMFLDCLDEDEEISEWRGINWDLNEDIDFDP